MKKQTTIFTLLIFMTILISACQARPAGATTASAEPSTNLETSPTQQVAVAEVAEVQTTMAQVQPTDDPALKVEKEVGQAVEAYFSAVSEGNTEAAVDSLSSFSLMVFQMTRGDAADALQAQKIAGIRWADLEILEVQPFDEQTMLVHITYTETGRETPLEKGAATPTPGPTQTAAAETIEALWPVRLEQGEWRYNWNNLIDFRTLDAAAQTTNGVTIMPTQLTRYSDRIQLSMLVQNRTNDGVVFGQVNETLATFHFGDQLVVAEKTQWVLNPLRSVPDATLEIKGLFTSYPDTVEIRKWNNYDVEPWYVFQVK